VPSPFDQLIDISHSNALDSWEERRKNALSTLVEPRYDKRAEISVTLRAPDMIAAKRAFPMPLT